MSLNKHLKQPPFQYWAYVWSWVLVWCHVIAGLAILSFQFPFATQEAKNRHIQKWSKRLLSIFGVELRLKNAEILPATPYLLASNHISWMDIHAINAFKPIRFVAKSDVEGCPIFVWMAKQLGTVFIRRDSARHGTECCTGRADLLWTSKCINLRG